MRHSVVDSIHSGCNLNTGVRSTFIGCPFLANNDSPVLTRKGGKILAFSGRPCRLLITAYDRLPRSNEVRDTGETVVDFLFSLLSQAKQHASFRT